MEPVPPPHERTWRHPSELAPPPVEETPRRVRIAAAVTGAASVALVGLFALTVTPSNSAVMVSSSTLTPSAVSANAATATTTWRPVGEADGSVASVTGGLSDDDMLVVLLDAGVTVTTKPETDPNGFPFATVYFTQRMSANGVLIGQAGEVRFVQLDPRRAANRALVERLDIPQYVVATSMPERDQEVTAMGHSPQQLRLDEVGDVELEPGTAVVDENNHLVAVCDEHGNLTMLAPGPQPDPPPATDEPSPPTATGPVASPRPETTTTTTTAPPGSGTTTTTMPDTTSTTTTTTIDESTTPATESTTTTRDATTTTATRPATTGAPSDSDD